MEVQEEFYLQQKKIKKGDISCVNLLKVKNLKNILHFIMKIIANVNLLVNLKIFYI